MPEITEMDKRSGMASRLKIDLEAKRDKLLKRCGRATVDDPATDQIITAHMRGQIKALTTLINEFTIGLESPVE